MYYTVNGCTDSTQITVLPNPNLSDSSICIEQSIFNISNPLLGGTWSGNGIVNPTNGSFLPSVAGVGTHSIQYITADNCYYSTNISVTAMPTVAINGLPNSWCLADTNFIILANPLNGNWLGTTLDSLFNPLQMGSGAFTISYSIGTGECLVSANTSIYIDDTLKILPYFIDTILCPDDLIKVGAIGLGGNELNYSFTWNNGLGNSFENIVYPNSDTIYTVSLNDGCSEQAVTTLTIYLQDDFNLSFETSDTVCYDEIGYAEVSILPIANYNIVWHTEPEINTARIDKAAGHSYAITVSDANGCSKQEYINIPAFEQIIADFTVSPIDECVDLLNPEIYIIDQSIGADKGTWYFDDGQTQDYTTENGNISHFYSDTGIFTIQLNISNHTICTDNHSVSICVKPKTRVIAPTAFSPNGDGTNDVFKVHVLGISDYDLIIANRWGEIVFQTNDINATWDGTFKNKKAEIGTYTWQVNCFSFEHKKKQTEKGSIQLIR